MRFLGYIGFDFANFCYFLEYRELLREVGVLPSFLRVEYNEQKQAFCSTDQAKCVHALQCPHLLRDDFILVNPPNPYMACFVLDAELAEEYVTTPYFQKGTPVSNWGVRENAAAGLCFANIPPSFKSRYVVPVSQSTKRAPYWTWISHFPNNYANNPHEEAGKVPMDELFILSE